MLELKRISREAISTSLEKAERYRLLNEPREAESICRDILQADSENQRGLVLLLLAGQQRVRFVFHTHIHASWAKHTNDSAFKSQLDLEPPSASMICSARSLAASAVEMSRSSARSKTSFNAAGMRRIFSRDACSL